MVVLAFKIVFPFHQMTKYYPKPNPEVKLERLLKIFSDAAGDIKGRWAEELLKVLFANIGYETIDTGVEDTHTRLAYLRRQNKIKYNILAGKRKSPDMAVILPEKPGQKYQTVIEVEVKYRDKGKIKVSELLEYKSLYHQDFRFVFFDREEIYVLNPKDIEKKTKTLDKGKPWQDDYIIFKHCVRLRNAKEFEFTNDQKILVSGFEKVSATLFSVSPNNKTIVGKIKEWTLSLNLFKNLRCNNL